MIKQNLYVLLFVSFAAILTNCTPPDEVDLVVHNAKIYTVNDAFEIKEAMVIDKGKIVAIGPENEILNKYRYAAKEIIDAKMHPIFPGFIDAHCHFVGYGLNLNQVNLVGTKSFDEVIEKVEAFSKNSNAEWIIGRGWDQNDWEVKDLPTRFELDKLFPDKPVFLVRIDGHAAIANKKALKMAGINSETTIKGGAILSTFIPDGDPSWIANQSSLDEVKHLSYPYWEPTGILIDNAVDLVRKHIPKPSNKEIEIALLKAQNDLFEVGVTTVDDAGLGKDTIDLIDQLQQENKLKMKVYAMISGNQPMLDYYLEHGPHKTDKLNVCSFKFYADGALGSRGACLIEPYSDIIEQMHHGLLIKEKSFFEKYAPLLYEKGFQMNTHCIGDSANRMILDIYGSVLKGVNDKRWRIEHAQVIHPNDMAKFKAFTVIPSIQSTHATSDMYWAEDRLGNERIKGAYAYQDLLKQNGIVALGTDFPVEDINPMKTFYAAVVRKDSKGYPEQGFQPENALTRKEALKGMTIWAAISNFEENEKGSLEVGKAADFVMLNQDIMEINENHILTTKVVYTFVDGELVYTSK